MGRTADGADLILTTPEEVERTPAGTVRRWLAELALADEAEKNWRKEATETFEIYESQKRKAASFNILWANTEILSAAVYNSTPQPDVRRRFRDRDPLGKAVSTVLERALSYGLDDYDFDAAVSDVVLDCLITGRGVARIKYEPSFAAAGVPAEVASGEPAGEEGAPAERLVDESVECEHVAWDRFRRGPGRRWREVPWVAFEHEFTFEMAEEKFGEAIARALTYEQGEGTERLGREEAERQTRAIFKTAKVWEIWDRDRRRVLFVAPAHKDRPCLEVEDPLHLRGFFPLPRPVYAIANSRSLVPTPLYRLYREQALELDRVSERINKIVDALRVRGLYSANLPEVAGVLDAADNEMKPVMNVSEIAAMGGLDKAIWLMPIDRLRQALEGLYAARDQIKQTIYEIMGIGDILRGASDPSETASAQRIKSQWGSLRIQKLQREIQRLVRDLLRLKAEAIAEHFTPRTLATITNVQLPSAAEKAQAQQALLMAQQTGQAPPPEAQNVLQTPAWEEVVQVLRSDALRQCRVDVETDSTVAETINRDMQGLAEIATSVGGILAAVQQGLPMETAKEFALAVVRRARLGHAVEDALEKLEQPPTAADPAADLEAMRAQIVELIKGEGAKVVKQEQAAAEQGAALQQYDAQIQAALGQVGQVAQFNAEQTAQAAAATQGNQQLLAQLAALIQQASAADTGTRAEVQAAVGEAMGQVAQAVEGVMGALGEVSATMQAVIEALQKPKQVSFQRDAQGRVRGATATLQ